MTEKWTGWAAWHPDEGFAMQHGMKIEVFDDLDRVLLDDVRELNDKIEADERKLWKAVKVAVYKEEWDPPENVPFGGPFR